MGRLSFISTHRLILRISVAEILRLLPLRNYVDVTK